MTKYLGAILQLIGVLVLAIPFFLKSTTNFTLIAGIVLVILGFVLHILLGRKANK